MADRSDVERASLIKEDAKGGSEQDVSACATHAAHGEAAKTTSPIGLRMRPVLYGLINVSSAVAIVVANKVVMYTYDFKFPVALTLIHMIVTAIGMRTMAWCALFNKNSIPLISSMQLASANVGSIVFNNLSLQWNTVSFYQISKVAMTPAVLLIEALAYKQSISRQVFAAILVLITGVFLSTVSDSQVTTNPMGIVVAALNVIVTSMCSVWTGYLQKHLQVDANQLLYSVSPHAVALLAVLVPLMEPIGLLTSTAADGTILGYNLTPSAALWILLGSLLGLVVTLSAYFFIGATSGTTYSVIAHVKTVVVVGCGVLLFGDSFQMRKVMGLVLTMGGIGWYTAARMREQHIASRAAA